MKKSIFVLFIACSVLFTAAGLYAKSSDPDFKNYSSAFGSGDMAVQLGLGLLHTGAYGDTVVPPISASLDLAKPIKKLPFSFGGYIGYSQSEDEYSFPGFFGVPGYSVKWTYTYYIFGVRVAYHVNFKVKGLDAYGGLLTGYTYVKVEEETSGTSTGSYGAEGSYLNYGGFVGARYFFTPKLGAFAELGYGVALLSFGVTYKI